MKACKSSNMDKVLPQRQRFNLEKKLFIMSSHLYEPLKSYYTQHGCIRSQSYYKGLFTNTDVIGYNTKF